MKITLFMSVGESLCGLKVGKLLSGIASDLFSHERLRFATDSKSSVFQYSNLLMRQRRRSAYCFVGKHATKLLVEGSLLMQKSWQAS